MEIATILALIRTAITAIPLGQRILRFFSGGVSIESVGLMHSDDDDALGFRVTIKNTRTANAVITQMEVSGFISQTERQFFYIELDATKRPVETMIRFDMRAGTSGCAR